MKYKALLIFFCCVILTLQAQHQLRSDFNTFRAGDHIVKQQVEFKDPGSSGRQLTWDFRMLQPVNQEYGLGYFIPDSSRMDILCGTEHRTRYYYQISNDSLWATGFENATTLMGYQVPELRLRFPFSYGDTLFSFFEGRGEYSHMLQLSVKGYTRVKADAEGELLLPDFETVKHALRVRTMRYYTETSPVTDLLPEEQENRLEMMFDTYSWYAEGIRYPVFESIKTDVIQRTRQRNGSDSVSDTTVFTTSFYYPPRMQTSQIHCRKTRTILQQVPQLSLPKPGFFLIRWKINSIWIINSLVMPALGLPFTTMPELLFARLLLWTCRQVITTPPSTWDIL